MPLNLSEWVKDVAKRGNLSDQEIAQFETLLSKPGVKQEVVDAFERQSDYSRRQAELQAKMAEEDSYAAQLATWEKDMKENFNKLQAERDAYQRQLYTVASQYNLTPEELQKAVSVAGNGSAHGNGQFTQHQAPVEPQEPAKKWLTKEEAGSYATGMFKINAKLIGLNQEHIRLYGKPMENIDSFVDEALKAGRPIEQTFRDFYKVADREAQLREEDTQRRIAAAIEDAKKSWVMAGADPFAAQGKRPAGEGSPIFEFVPDLKTPELGDNAAHRTRVNEAVEAFQRSQLQDGRPPV